MRLCGQGKHRTAARASHLKGRAEGKDFEVAGGG